MKRMVYGVTVLLIGALLLCPSGVWAKDPDVFKIGFMSSLSGPFAGVAETQRKAVLLAADEINKKGGLNMPWGKVKVEVLVKDDELKLDVGVRRFRELVGDGINALTGSIYNPMAAALNEEAKITKTPYLPCCVPALDSFKKGNPAAGTFSVAFTPWSIGYLTGASAIKTLNKKKIFYLSRSDSWGATTHEGLKAACKEFGGEIIGFAEVPKGTADYTAIINKVIAAKPDIFVTCMFGGDAIACLNQAQQIGLYKQCTVFNTWITNVVAAGIPQDALNGLYALEYWYYGMQGFEDKALVEKAKAYTEAYEKMWNEPPDPFSMIASVACDVIFQAVEKAGTFDPTKVSKVLAESKFDTQKGEVFFREDHQLVAKYMAFLVKGKAPEERKAKFDVFTVEGYFGGEQALPSLESMGY